jgi:membrane fusion protein (multidrug efflux system)
MDQRVDSERRSESVPSRNDTPAGGAAAKGRSWRQTLRQRRGLVILIALATVIALVALVVWWLNARQYETTDDAFIDARTVQISPQISAAIVDVPVNDNQLVEAGTVLVRLDHRDFRTQVDQTHAQIDQSRSNIENIDAQIGAQEARIDQANSQVVQAQAALAFAQQQNDRYQQLVKSDTVSVEQAQQYESNLR